MTTYSEETYVSIVMKAIRNEHDDLVISVLGAYVDPTKATARAALARTEEGASAGAVQVQRVIANHDIADVVYFVPAREKKAEVKVPLLTDEDFEKAKDLPDWRKEHYRKKWSKDLDCHFSPVGSELTARQVEEAKKTMKDHDFGRIEKENILLKAEIDRFRLSLWFCSRTMRNVLRDMCEWVGDEIFDPEDSDG